MATIVGPPRPEKIVERRVRCDTCDSLIQYEASDVRSYHGTDYGGGPDGYERVKCPASGCDGYGYIKRW